MTDPVGLVVSVLGALGRAREAVESAHNFPTAIQDRLADTESVLQQLRRAPRQVSLISISRELDQLNDLAFRIQTLVQDHAAAPKDSWCRRVCKSITRCSRHKELEKQLQEIHGDVDRVVAAVAAKGTAGAVLPPHLTDTASVPAGALASTEASNHRSVDISARSSVGRIKSKSKGQKQPPPAKSSSAEREEQALPPGARGDVDRILREEYSSI